MATEKRLIDADALGSFSFHIECEEDGETFERCVVDWDDIEAAPIVDAVEVVHGYTIVADEPVKVLLDRKCSICDQLMLATDNYCSMCGAKNEGERIM